MSLPAHRADRAGLVSRTDPLDDVPGLIARLPATGGVAWIREDEGFIGWGEAARVRVGTGPGRFERAAAALQELLSTAEVRNAVGGWGTGPLAFGSFAFDPDSPASALVIPAVIIGASGGRAWVTRTGRGTADSETHADGGTWANCGGGVAHRRRAIAQLRGVRGIEGGIGRAREKCGG